MTFLDDDHESYDALLALLDGGSDDTLVAPDAALRGEENELLRCIHTSSAADPFASALDLIDESTSPVSPPSGDDDNDDALASLLLQDELIRGDVAASPLAHWPVDRVLMLATTPPQLVPPHGSITTNTTTQPVCETTAPPAAAPQSSHNTATRPSRTGTKQTKKPRSWDPNKARKEQRAELLYLREQVAQLETQLSDLQTATAAAGPTGALSSGRSDPSQHSQLANVRSVLQPPSPWKDIARHEQCARLEAEADNARMKLVLENQLSIAKSLETILRATASTEVRLHCLACRWLVLWPAVVLSALLRCLLCAPCRRSCASLSRAAALRTHRARSQSATARYLTTCSRASTRRTQKSPTSLHRAALRATLDARACARACTRVDAANRAAACSSKSRRAKCCRSMSTRLQPLCGTTSPCPSRACRTACTATRCPRFVRR